MELSERKLDFPAARRCSHPTGGGKFCTKPYTIQDVALVLDSGGWFAKGGHDFADGDAKELAMEYYN